MIKLGNQEFSPTGFEKVYRGSELMYQKKNKAPYTCCGLYHCNTNLVDCTGSNYAVGSFGEVVGVFDKGTNSSNLKCFNIGQFSVDQIKTGDCYFEFWYKNPNQATGEEIIVGQTNNSGGLTFVDNATWNTTGISVTNGWVDTSSREHIYTPSDLDFTTWTHVAFQFHTGKLYCFINGKLTDKYNVAVNPKSIGSIAKSWQNSSCYYDEIMCCREAYHLADFNVPTMPYEMPWTHQEVNYIESSGTEYINTTYNPFSTIGVEMKYALTEADDTKTYIMFGSYAKQYQSSGVVGRIQCGIVTGNQFFGYGNATSDGSQTAPMDLNDHIAKQESNKLYIDSNLKYTLSSSSFGYKAPICFCANGYYNEASVDYPILVANNFAKMKLYYAKIYNGSNLARNFIPVYRSDGQACLYETLQGNYYINKGSGSFTYG